MRLKVDAALRSEGAMLACIERLKSKKITMTLPDLLRIRSLTTIVHAV